MQLNIYKISHPIIKVLSNANKQKEQTIISSSYYYKHIGFLIMYEVLRKYILIEHVYIKCLYSTKLFNLIDKSKKYIVLTNLYDNYEMITELKILLPNIDIININSNNTINNKINIRKIGHNIKDIEIFILKKELKSTNILQIIQYLTLEQKIPISNVKIACIVSYQKILTKLGYEYPQLKIYTTEISHLK